MSVITQNGDSVLMIAARKDNIDIVSLILKAGTNTDLQKKVCIYMAVWFWRILCRV